MTNPLRIPRRPARVPRAGPRLRSRVGLLTVAGAFALTATVVGADILADRLSDRRSSATVAQLGGPTARLTLVNTSDEGRRFNLSKDFALLSGLTSAARPPHPNSRRLASLADSDAVRLAGMAGADTLSQLNRLNPGGAIDAVIYFDTIVPMPGDPPLVLRWSRSGDVDRLALPIGGVGIDHHGS